MNRVDRLERGFTLIELMLAMAFVSALLIAVAMTVIQIANIYNRGLTLKDVNQAGRSLSSELQRSIAESNSFDLPTMYIPHGGATPYGGRLCTGQYSYIWNYGEAIDKGPIGSINHYANPPIPASDYQIRFVKVLDPGSSYCINPATNINYTNSTELIDADASNKHDLAVHNFSIDTQPTAIDTTTGQQLYDINFIIGTNNQSALKGNLDTTQCLIPSDVIAGKEPDPAYCSVVRFDLVARAGNMVE